jgi:hypothetical protein
MFFSEIYLSRIYKAIIAMCNISLLRSLKYEINKDFLACLLLAYLQ